MGPYYYTSARKDIDSILFPFYKVRNSSVLEKQMKSVSSNVFSGTGVIVWRTTTIPIFTPPDGGWKMEELLQRILWHHHINSGMSMCVVVGEGRIRRLHVRGRIFTKWHCTVLPSFIWICSVTPDSSSRVNVSVIVMISQGRNA